MKKIVLFVFTFFVIPLSMLAQDCEILVVQKIDTYPSFTKGECSPDLSTRLCSEQKLLKYLNKSFDVPGQDAQPATSENLKIAVVSFTIDTTGDVSSVFVSKSSGSISFDMAAEKAVQGTSGMGTSAVHKGKRIQFRYNIPISIRIE